MTSNADQTWINPKTLTLVAVVTRLTRVTLSSNSNDVADFDRLSDLVPDPENLSDDFMSDNLRIHLGHVSPSGRGGVQVRSADPAIQDLD